VIKGHFDTSFRLEHSRMERIYLIVILFDKSNQFFYPNRNSSHLLLLLLQKCTSENSLGFTVGRMYEFRAYILCTKVKLEMLCAR
jgi:hypothetical protein